MSYPGKVNGKVYRPQPLPELDLHLLRRINQAKDGWYARGLDPYKREHLIAARLLVLIGDKVYVTKKGKELLETQGE